MKNKNNFDYDSKSNNADTSQIADSLKSIVTKAENSGFDSLDTFANKVINKMS